MLWGRLFPHHQWHHLEQRSQVAARWSPTSPAPRSKWKVRAGGWHWPKPWQHSGSQYSLTQLPLVTSLHTEFMALCLLLLALTVGEFDLKFLFFKKRVKYKQEIYEHMHKNWRAGSWGLQNKCTFADNNKHRVHHVQKKTHFAVYSHAITAYSMSHCCQRWPAMNIIEAWSTSVKVQRHTE